MPLMKLVPPPVAAKAPAKADSGKPLCLVATRIVSEAVGDNVSVVELAKLAQSDPGFVLRLLAVINSAAYGRGNNKVSDVRQACALLGVSGLRNVALGLVVDDMIPMGDDGVILLTTSLRRAVGAQLIATALGDRALADEAFTAGMLLEVGLLSRARTDLAGSAQVARMPAAHRSVFERAQGHVDHAASGAKLCADMHLPAAMVEAIAHHHDPAPPASKLGKIVWAAERIAAAWEGGDVARIRADANKALATIGVPANAMEQLFTRIPELVTVAAVSFERKIDEQLDLDKLALDAHARLVEMNQGYEHIVRRLESLLAEKEALALELQKTNLEFKNLSVTDALTSLPNRRAFTEALTRDLSMADRTSTCVSLVVIDVDHFKKFNDTYGHATGDLVLVKVGEVLRASLRTSDLAARYGGEEFVCILTNTASPGALIVADRTRAMLEAAVIESPQGPLKVTASFGVASVKGPGCKDLQEALFKRADAALYEAKHAGRNRCAVATT
jgi:diguanylate cyclase (GGDEF)-like protein